MPRRDSGFSAPSHGSLGLPYSMWFQAGRAADAEAAYLLRVQYVGAASLLRPTPGDPTASVPFKISTVDIHYKFYDHS